LTTDRGTSRHYVNRHDLIRYTVVANLLIVAASRRGSRFYRKRITRIVVYGARIARSAGGAAGNAAGETKAASR